jgi:hypothetical protein
MLLQATSQQRIHTPPPQPIWTKGVRDSTVIHSPPFDISI